MNVKIDTEGSELEILKGATKSLQHILGLEVECEFFKLREKQPLFSEIQKFLENYDFEFKNDVALVFIINSLNKKEKQNKLHAVFFNTNSREILLSTPLVTGPEGFGFRNYWIGSIHNVLKVLGKNEYKKWKKLYKK